MIQSYYNIIDCIPYAVLYISLTCFTTESLYLLISFTYFIYSPTSFHSGNLQFILCVCEPVSVYSFLLFLFVFFFGGGGAAPTAYGSPRPGIKPTLQLVAACDIAVATLDP